MLTATGRDGDRSAPGTASTLVEASAPEVDDAGARHSQVWFGPADRPLYGWLSVPRGLRARGGVVLCPPMGEEGRASHRTYRQLAEALADAGLLALRFDYDGTGDSAGAQDDPDRVAAWLASVESARAYLTGLGVPDVSAVGMRLGATLAGCQAAAAGAFDSLVLWDPCVSGRTFLREGQALYSFGEASTEASTDGTGGSSGSGGTDDGYRHTPGFQYDDATARGLRTVDLGRLPTDARLARRVLLLVREDRPTPDAVVARVEADRAAGAEVHVEPALDQDRLLDLPPSDNFVPDRTLAHVVAWLEEGVADIAWHPVAEPRQEHAVVLSSAGPGSALVSERVVRVGDVGLYGIADEPLGAGHDPADQGPRPWVVLVNVAAEHHVGPGRRWVEFARQWAAMGYRCIRLDQSGIGDSPTRPGQLEDEPFAPEWIDDMRQLLRALSADGSTVALVGLCSGAYSACEAALWGEPGVVAGILAINPRLTIYPAAKGSPVYTSERRAALLPVRPVAALAHRHRNTAGGIWRIYRQLAVWHAPYTVLAKVVRRGTTLRVISCRMDAREFTEVAFWQPALWRLRRHPRFSFEIDDVFDHSLLGRRGQQTTYDRATEFVKEMYDDAPSRAPRPVRRR